MKIAFYTLGCKVNQYESNWLSEEMQKNGYVAVSPSQKADVYVINSCTVTSESDRKTRQSVRRFKRTHPESIVVLTGCMPQAFPEDAEKLTDADIVIGNKNNALLPSLIERYIAGSGRIVLIEPHESGEKFAGCSISGFEGRTRAIVKIEDGCDRFCSYCIIPYSRGRVRSKPPEELKSEFAHLVSNGFREAVLVGINLSAYGKGEDYNICSAVRLAAEAGFKRVRLGSLEPDHITKQVIKELAEIPQFCPQFHISLQSGCDKTLKKMNRHYTSEEYKELCYDLRSTFPDATITTDIMVGFPYESDEDFETSVSFAEEIGFEKVHVFPYSPREGTPAAKMEQIDKSTKEKRSREMIRRTGEIRQKFLNAQIGRTLSVLFETRHSDGFTEGYTPNYTPVKVAGECECGEIKDVLITGVEGDFCIGKISE